MNMEQTRNEECEDCYGLSCPHWRQCFPEMRLDVDELQAANKTLRVEVKRQYRKGYEDGLEAYAWWKDGVQYVGSCGTTLKQALKEEK